MVRLKTQTERHWADPGNQRTMCSAAACFVAVLLAFALMPAPVSAAQFEIDQGAGFDDPQARPAVGGNAGTTLGARRSAAIEYAADLLGKKIDSAVAIQVQADFVALSCSASTGVTGQGGPTVSLRDFDAAPQSNVFYPIALANALAGRDLMPPDNDSGPATDIGVEFNSSIDGNDTCLADVDWYYGFDGRPPNGDIDFVSTVVHELIHGLGFISNVALDAANRGRFSSDIPSVFDTLIFDQNYGRFWPQLSDNERSASVANDPLVVFGGPNTSINGAPTLQRGGESGCVQLHAPESVERGSSISHWADALSPNALMEPRDADDINFNTGVGLATCALADLGWSLASGVTCPDSPSGDPPLEAQDHTINCATGTTNDTSEGSAGSESANNENSSGGGCALTGDQTRFDPLAPLLVLAATLGLWRRRLRPA